MKEETCTAAQELLRSYQLCAEMLYLRRDEKERAADAGDDTPQTGLLAGSEAYWQAQMYEAEQLIAALRSGREKLLLYYRYIRGESVEHAADLLGVSRRTGYRLHRRGLLAAEELLSRLRSGEEDGTERAKSDPVSA